MKLHSTLAQIPPPSTVFVLALLIKNLSFKTIIVDIRGICRETLFLTFITV